MKKMSIVKKVAKHVVEKNDNGKFTASTVKRASRNTKPESNMRKLRILKETFEEKYSKPAYTYSKKDKVYRANKEFISFLKKI